MKKIYVYVVMLISVTVNSQSFTFENHTPLWSHFSKSNTKHEKILWYLPMDILLNGDDLYLTHQLVANYFDGHLLEKINLNSGELKWTNTIMGTDGLNREYPNLPYFDVDNNLNMLVFQQKDTFSNYTWSSSVFGHRKYDTETGVVIDSSFASKTDTTVFQLTMPLKIFLPWPFNSFLEPRPEFQDSFYYIKEISSASILNYHYYKLDNEGRSSNYKVVKSTYVHKNNILKAVTSKKVGGDTRLVLKHAVEFGKEKVPYDLTCDIIIGEGVNSEVHNLNITEQVSAANYFTLSYADEKSFIVSAFDSIQGFQENRFYNFDYDGNLIEKTSIRSKEGDTRYSVGIPTILKSSGKMLFVLSKDDAQGRQIEYFMKSDGFGGLITASKLKISNIESEINPRKIYDIDENRFLVNFRQPISIGNQIKSWSNWIMFSKDELGLLTSISEEKYSNEINIFPNPVKNILNISINNQKIRSYEIFDDLGNVVAKSKHFNKQINVSNLLPGIYLVRLNIDGEMKTISFVKI